MPALPAALLLAVLISPRPARAQAAAELCAQSGSQDCSVPKFHPSRAAAAPESRACPSDFRKRRTGDCWVGQGEERLYVHPAGWLVEARCFSDKRFSAAELRRALDAAARKMSPDVALEKGGCLSYYNQDWARELTDLPWRKNIFVRCPAADPAESKCARERDVDDQNDVITLARVERCLGPGGTGLGGLLFHETLHADKADSLPVEQHNLGADLPRLTFVHDSVYAADALCFLGTQDKTLVNFTQCLTVTAHPDYNHPKRGLCQGFSTNYSDLGDSFYKD